MYNGFGFVRRFWRFGVIWGLPWTLVGAWPTHPVLGPEGALGVPAEYKPFALHIREIATLASEQWPRNFGDRARFPKPAPSPQWGDQHTH